MKTFESLDDLPAVDHPVSLAIGIFDGFHRGHQQVVATAEHHARRCNGNAWLLTFEPHPIQVLHPEKKPPRISSADARRRLAEAHGLDAFIQHPFTPDFSLLSPEAFIDLLRQRMPTLHSVSVGANWRFGHEARGTVSDLAALGARLGFEVEAANPVLHHGLPVSSTRIRRALLTGDVTAAREMLGRAYAIEGLVVHGAKVGRQLGFPTANIAVESEIVPPDGIYGIFARIDDTLRPGAGYRGPSNRGNGPMLEVHLFDEDRDLYGRRIEVLFHDRERDHHHFASREDLIGQIGRDVASIRSRLAPSSTA